MGFIEVECRVMLARLSRGGPEKKSQLEIRMKEKPDEAYSELETAASAIVEHLEHIKEFETVLIKAKEMHAKAIDMKSKAAQRTLKADDAILGFQKIKFSLEQAQRFTGDATKLLQKLNE